MARALPRGLYAIVDTGVIPAHERLGFAAAAIRGGAVMIQYRDKRSRQERLQEAAALAALCRTSNVPFIVNDDIALAAAVQAQGVHLGRDDPSIENARQLLGPQAIIGSSCYASLRLAAEAQQRGADYVAFGAMYASSTKPGVLRAQALVVQAASCRLQIPIAAIGGISSSNVGRISAAGADLVAVISGLKSGQDVQQAAHSIQSRWQDSAIPIP